MRSTTRRAAVLGAWCSLAAVLPASGESVSPWSDVAAGEVEARAAETRRIAPERARYARLDRGALQALLAQAPDERSAPRGLPGVELALPSPAGGERRYRLVDSPILEPGLAARHPEWRTFRLIDVADPRYGGRGDWTKPGFHAMVRTPDGLVFVDPLFAGDDELYQIYRKADLARRPGAAFRCAVEDDPAEPAAPPPAEAPSAGLDLRTYRLAVAATGEYTQYFGGTVEDGEAAIVVAVNRVDEVYENDLAIRMILVADNDLVVYTDGATDPYANNNGAVMLLQNQTTLDAVIGSANYDIGHVFSTGGGGIANVGVVCGTNKAKGVTGLTDPVGDAFYIDYVAHEMGHQWGGHHTFNGTSGFCGGGNRTASSAYEPGSGSTIMAYAGICDAEDLQPHSDAYFHRRSLDELETYSRGGAGNACAAVVADGNLAPVTSAGSDFTIPISTPFALTGSAVDPDGDPLTFCWEQFDLGPASPGISGNAPIFRSFTPGDSPTRTFPKIEALAAGTTSVGETLPTYARTMHFRLTARDDAGPAGAEGYDEATLTVSAAAGPFQVTDPNTAVVWSGPGPHAIAWNVAGTNLSPISCATVDVALSTDGGLTFPRTLATNLPNDGADFVYAGTPDTTTARVRVACHGNVFFDLSNVDFTITGAADFLFADGFESGGSGRWSDTLAGAR